MLSRILLHIKYPGLCNVHWPALFILKRYVHKAAWQPEAPPYEWFIPNNRSYNLEKEGGRKTTQTLYVLGWNCLNLLILVNRAVAGGNRRAAAEGLFSIPSQFHGLTYILHPGGACKCLSLCPSGIDLQKLHLRRLALKCRAVTSHSHKKVFEFHVQCTVIYSIHFHEAITSPLAHRCHNQGRTLVLLFLFSHFLFCCQAFKIPWDYTNMKRTSPLVLSFITNGKN